MRADYHSYRRAAGVCLLGAAIQAVLGSALLIYGLLRADPAAVTSSIFVLLGIVVWVALAVVFDQHRRERIEAVEQENFAAQDLTGSSVFEDAGADLRVAARRLDNLYKFMLPAVSLLIGAGLIAAGVVRLGIDAPEGQDAAGSHGWGIAIGLAVAVIGFVFARFSSGMAGAKVWENLRGGSVYAVGSSLLGLLIAVAQFTDLAGVPGLLAVLNRICASALIVLGAEVFVSFVLDIYRPRKPGEYPRPAFDSRLLGFAATGRIVESISEAINYQFGFEVTSSWFYRLLSRSFLWLVLIGGGVLWLMSAFAVVEPHQRALLTINGAALRELAPGLHVKPPWPIGRVIVPDYLRQEKIGEGDEARTVEVIERTSTGVRLLELASDPAAQDKPVLWGDEALKETLLVVQRQAASGSGFGGVLGRDLSLVSVRVPLYYSVAPGQTERFLMLGRDAAGRDAILKLLAQREMIRELGSRTIGELLGPGREDVRRSLQTRIAGAFQAVHAGVEVVFVGFEDVRPPRAAAESFEHVLEASQKREQAIASAQQHRAETLSATIGSTASADRVLAALDEYDALRTAGAGEERLIEKDIQIRGLIEGAGGEAADTILKAQGERWRTHMGARSSSQRYAGLLDAFSAAPEIVSMRLKLAEMADALADLRVYIVDERVKIRTRFDLKDVYLGTDVFEPEVEGL
jgi:regulator of protease activity HflC (stomatin/prohibitin superfamily)